jgi:hypothetical protein
LDNTHHVFVFEVGRVMTDTAGKTGPFTNHRRVREDPIDLTLDQHNSSGIRVTLGMPTQVV